MKYIGKIIRNRYKLYDKVGSGGMATVYLARDLRTNEVVAVKILHEGFANNQKYVDRFLKEAELVLGMKQENIVEVKDFGKFENTYFIVMEYIQGKTLEEVIGEKGKLSPEETVKVAIGVARALEYAHDHGLIAHRDIKPQNIMITTDGKIKVTDFGIAKATGKEGLTASGAILGTPYYISPEQAKGQAPDIRSDLYSLGITLYQALTGKLPYTGDTPWSIINMHITSPIPKIEDENIPDSLKNIVFKLLQKEPEERYQTPKELLKDLENFRNKEEQFDKTVIIDISKTEKAEEVSNKSGRREEISAETEKKSGKNEEFEEKREKTVIISTAPLKESGITPKRKISFPVLKESPPEKAKNFFSLLKRNKYFVAALIGIIAVSVAIIFIAARRPVRTANNDTSLQINTGTETTSQTEQGNPWSSNSETNAGNSTVAEKTTGNLTVNTTPPGAKIILDNQDIGFTTPCTIKNLKPGKYTVTLKKENYETVSKEVEIKEGKTATISVNLRKREKFGYISVVTNPAGAEIIIDGTDKGVKTPNMVKIKPGEHTLTLRKTGYHSHSVKVNVEAGKTLKLTMSLQKVISGKIAVNSTPQNAEIFIDNKDTSYKTPHTFELKPGKHTVTLKLKGYKEYRRTVNVKEGGSITLEVKLERTETPDTKTFRTDDYSFSYPADWTLEEHPDEYTDLRIDSKAYPDDYVATCFVYKDNLKEEDLDFEEVLNETKTEYLKDCKVISENYVTVNGNKYYKLVMQGTGEDEDGNPMPLKVAVFFLRKGDMLYTIEFDATPQDFPKAWKGFEIIINSFSLKP